MPGTHLFEPHTKSLSSSPSLSFVTPTRVVPVFAFPGAAAEMLGADASLWMDDPSMNFWLAIVAAATTATDVATAAPLVRAYIDLRGPERCENHR